MQKQEEKQWNNHADDGKAVEGVDIVSSKVSAHGLFETPAKSSLRRPLLTPMLLGWMVGTAVQLGQDTLSLNLIYACFTVCVFTVCALLAIKSAADSWRMVLALVGGAALAFALCGARASSFAGQALSPELEGRNIQMVGVIAAMPQRNAGGTRFRFEVESASVSAVSPAVFTTERSALPGESVVAVTVPPLLYLGWYATPNAAVPPALVPGERWQLTVRLKAPHGNSNPHGFDYELWLWEQGLQATGYVRVTDTVDAPQWLAQTHRHPLEQARLAVRDAIFAAVPERRTAGIIAALVVGDQAAIERADWDVFRATGVAHLMSISGLHVTLFAWLAAWVLGQLWRRSGRLCKAMPAPSAALVGGVLLAMAYAMFSGWGVPSQRTVAMLATVALLRLSGYNWPWPVMWLLTVAVVLVLDPWAMLQAGFWLSFVAVAVLFISSAERDAVAAPDPPGYWLLVLLRRLWPPFRALLREQAVVTLALTPLTLLLFGQFSVVGLVANLVAIPWVTLVVTPLAMLGVLWSPVWALCAGSLKVLDVVLQLLNSFSFATVSTAAPEFWVCAVGLFGGVLLAMRLPWALRGLGVPLLLPVLLWQAPRPVVGQFELLAADVGQGNAVLVRTAGHSLLYDTGPRFGADSDAGHRVLVPLLRALDVKLDTLVLSHRDLDHTGGAPAVLAMQPQATLLSSIESAHELQALRPATRCLAGQYWQWDGVEFEVLHPLPADYDAAAAGRLKPNGLSCVLRISSGMSGNPSIRSSALLVGDIEQPQEAALLAGADRDKLKVDFLLVPHHGSKTSSSAAFLDAVKPHVAVVQAGYRNRFGHPVPSVVARYKAQGVQLVDAAHCGAALWSSERPERLDCQRAIAPHYWQHSAP